MKKVGIPVVVGLALFLGAGVAPLAAQNAISARSGMVHFASGKVFLDNQPVTPKFGEFPQMTEQSVLHTEKGRAEVLLSPGTILRLSDDSSIRLLSTSVENPDIELLSGSFFLECIEIPKKNLIRLRHGDYSFEVNKAGLFRVDTTTGVFRVFEGKAMVRQGDQFVEVKKGRMLAFSSGPQVAKFDRKQEVDSFYNWNSYRSYDIARASFVSASRLYNSGMNWGMGGWIWNPFYSLFTYIPANGVLMSPFGWQYWSPRGYYYAVVMPRYEAPGGGGGWNRDLGYTTVPRTSAGTSGTVAASGDSSAGSVRGGSAPISRDPGGGGRSR